MRIFDGTTWGEGFLDEHRGKGELRVRPTRWATIAPVVGLAISPERSVRRVIDYARQIGPVRLARKVASRWGERGGHQTVAACGIGEVLEADAAERVGKYVMWFSPAVPPGCERIVVDERLAREVDPRAGAFTFVDIATTGLGRELFGWSRFSGAELRDTNALLDQCENVLSTAVVQEVVDWDSSEIREIEPGHDGPSTRAVTVFGWGHHARTQMAPALPDDWAIDRIHEIDPRRHGDVSTTWDTSPTFRDDEVADVVCLAGFHATHGPLASEALRRGSTVVVEKPVVTTQEQLDELMGAWVEPSRLFTLYHRRYGQVAHALAEDLQGPVDMHATVFEIPLPERHWYRWPSSGGRIVCNGCHWIDQFMWLNPGADVTQAEASRGPRGQIVANLSLSNGAFFTLILTDRGSARRGTREVTEFRTTNRTVRLVDGADYVCECEDREVRRFRTHPLDALEAAYAEVFGAIQTGKPGDTRESVERTHLAMLRLAELASQE